MSIDVLWLVPTFMLGVLVGLAYAIWKINRLLEERRRP